MKPYVVFVAPPSLEKLRQKKIRSGEAYKVIITIVMPSDTGRFFKEHYQLFFDSALNDITYSKKLMFFA